MRSTHRAAAAVITPAPPMEKLGFTIPEASEVSSLGQTSIYKAIREGKLKCRKFGTRTIITRSDLTAFLENLPVETKGPRDEPRA
jgi:excisionase family DNA binding protein